MGRYGVKIAFSADGERLPLLLGSDGVHIWGATVFALTELLTRNRAASPIENTT